MRSNITKFENLLNTDTDVQAKILEAMSRFTGDKSDEKAVFDAVIAPIAADAGCAFTYDEIVASHKAADEQLSEEELQAVSGGTSISIQSLIAKLIL